MEGGTNKKSKFIDLCLDIIKYIILFPVTSIKKSKTAKVNVNKILKGVKSHVVNQLMQIFKTYGFFFRNYRMSVIILRRRTTIITQYNNKTNTSFMTINICSLI